ncbi:MAG TPA: type 4a pilus biogenesis protein PilO [Candidatus Methylomirabilis sp.]|nr:type 4a pilus biogenesis protein PilO [Candidatus Methylomirabilis sp.]
MMFQDAIANVTRPQRILAGTLGVVVLAAVGYFLLISPKVSERSLLRADSEKLQEEVRRARADEANLRPFRRQAEALRNRLQAAKERLPSEKEIPRLYRQLTDIASQSGLQLALFAPKPLVDREDVAEVPIAMTCEGSYHQLGTFFSRISRLPRIVDLGDFRLVGIERPTGTMRAELTLGTFVFRPDAAPVPTKAAPAAGRVQPPTSGGEPAKPRIGL